MEFVVDAMEAGGEACSWSAANVPMSCSCLSRSTCTGDSPQNCGQTWGRCSPSELVHCSTHSHGDGGQDEAAERAGARGLVTQHHHHHQATMNNGTSKRVVPDGSAVEVAGGRRLVEDPRSSINIQLSLSHNHLTSAAAARATSSQPEAVSGGGQDSGVASTSVSYQHHRDREQRLRQFKQHQLHEAVRRKHELVKQEEQASRQREHAEHERRRRVEELKQRESERRAQVEDRRRRMEVEEADRRSVLVRRHEQRDVMLETRRRHQASQIVFGFGSSTPRWESSCVSPSSSSSLAGKRCTSALNVDCDSHVTDSVSRGGVHAGRMRPGTAVSPALCSARSRGDEMRMSRSVHEALNWTGVRSQQTVSDGGAASGGVSGGGGGGSARSRLQVWQFSGGESFTPAGRADSLPPPQQSRATTVAAPPRASALGVRARPGSSMSNLSRNEMMSGRHVRPDLVPALPVASFRESPQRGATVTARRRSPGKAVSMSRLDHVPQLARARLAGSTTCRPLRHHHHHHATTTSMMCRSMTHLAVGGGGGSGGGRGGGSVQAKLTSPAALHSGKPVSGNVTPSSLAHWSRPTSALSQQPMSASVGGRVRTRPAHRRPRPITIAGLPSPWQQQQQMTVNSADNSPTTANVPVRAESARRLTVSSASSGGDVKQRVATTGTTTPGRRTPAQVKADDARKKDKKQRSKCTTAMSQSMSDTVQLASPMSDTVQLASLMSDSFETEPISQFPTNHHHDYADNQQLNDDGSGDAPVSVPGTSVSVPGTSVSVPGTSVSVPCTSVSVPGTSVSVPGTSVSVHCSDTPATVSETEASTEEQQQIDDDMTDDHCLQQSAPIDTATNEQQQQQQTLAASTDDDDKGSSAAVGAGGMRRAGYTSEQEARAALAEKRRRAREDAERQAELERQRAEEERVAEERRQAEEEEQRRREEEEHLRLVEEARQAEEQRLQLAIEEAERERLLAEQQRADEEMLRQQREQEENRAREEAERVRREAAVKLQQEEAERKKRRSRVAEIMSRTRTTTASPHEDKYDEDSVVSDESSRCAASVGEVTTANEQENSNSNNSVTVSQMNHTNTQLSQQHNNNNNNSEDNKMSDCEPTGTCGQLDTGENVSRLPASRPDVIPRTPPPPPSQQQQGDSMSCVNGAHSPPPSPQQTDSSSSSSTSSAGGHLDTEQQQDEANSSCDVSLGSVVASLDALSLKSPVVALSSQQQTSHGDHDMVEQGVEQFSNSSSGNTGGYSLVTHLLPAQDSAVTAVTANNNSTSSSNPAAALSGLITEVESQ